MGSLHGKMTDNGQHKHSILIDYDYGETDVKTEKTFGIWDEDKGTDNETSIVDTFFFEYTDKPNHHEGGHIHDVDIDAGYSTLHSIT